MKCNEIREAIDTPARHTLYGDPVTSHLSGCPDCRRHADETTALLTLLSAQPRIQAPADFDFRLRARIARAQAEQAAPANMLQGILQNWQNWAQTFSWGEAATAMAAAALVIMASTFYINHRDQSPLTAEKSSMQTKVAVATNPNPPPVDAARSSAQVGAVAQTSKQALTKFVVKQKASSSNHQNVVTENI